MEHCAKKKKASPLSRAAVTASFLLRISAQLWWESEEGTLTAISQPMEPEKLGLMAFARNVALLKIWERSNVIHGVYLPGRLRGDYLAEVSALQV